MEKNDLLLYGAVGLGLYAAFGMKSNEPCYQISPTQCVPASQLPSLGYINVGGQWWSQQQIAAAASQGGVNVPNTMPNQGDNTWQVIGTILNTVTQFVPLIEQWASGSGSGSGASGASSGP